MSAALSGREFVEGFPAQALPEAQRPEAVLAVLRELYFGRHAQPLVLVFEAASSKRRDMLAELSPELRDAARPPHRRAGAGRGGRHRAFVRGGWMG